MFKNIIDFKILNLYSKDYSSSYSIREITKILNINYSHTFKRINELVKEGILTKEKKGQANNITFNIKNLEAVKLLSFVEENKKIENPTLKLVIKEATNIDPFSCIGLFGSRVSGKAKKDSDWDVLILTNYPVDLITERKFRNELYNLELETGEPFSVFAYSKKDWNTRQKVTPFYRNVTKEGVLI